MRGTVAPLVRRALELIAAGAPGVDRLVAVEIPGAMAPRLALSDLSAAGAGRAVVVSGGGIGACRIALVLHGDGARYTLALRCREGALPPELARGVDGLDVDGPPIHAGDAEARESVEDAVASLTRAAGELCDDHRFWGDLGALIMLADLVEEGTPSG